MALPVTSFHRVLVTSLVTMLCLQCRQPITVWEGRTSTALETDARRWHAVYAPVDLLMRPAGVQHSICIHYLAFCC